MATAAFVPPPSSNSTHGTSSLLPGLGLCLLVMAAAYALEAGERALFGKA